MKIIEFLDLYKIKWRHVSQIEKEGKVITGDFVLIDTGTVQQLDIDEPCLIMNSLFFNCPYYESITKKLPHFFCHLKVEGLYGKLTAAKVDYLSGIATYAHADAIVHNSEKPIRAIEFLNPGS